MSANVTKSLQWICTNRYNNILCVLRKKNSKLMFGYFIVGNKTAGTYKEFLKASAIDTCAIQCCIQKTECNVAFVFNEKCFHVKCKSDDQCMPLERTNMETKLKMVLVNPVAPGSNYFYISSK